MRLSKINIVLLVILAAVVGINLFFLSKHHGVQDAAPLSSPQTDAADDFSVQIDDISLLLDQEITGIVYFGRDSCPECAVFNDALRLILTELPDLKIYKFDTDYWREDIQYHEVLELYGVDRVPMLIYIAEDKTIQSLFEWEKTVQEIYESILEVI